MILSWMTHLSTPFHITDSDTISNQIPSIPRRDQSSLPKSSDYTIDPGAAPERKLDWMSCYDLRSYHPVALLSRTRCFCTLSFYMFSFVSGWFLLHFQTYHLVTPFTLVTSIHLVLSHPSLFPPISLYVRLTYLDSLWIPVSSVSSLFPLSSI